VDVVGPLCSPLDSLGRNLKLPRLQPGDQLAIPNVGAYGLSASLLGFLSHPPPREIVCSAEKVLACYQWRWGHEKIKLPPLL
jgi:diaminopimelate decarboxylase